MRAACLYSGHGAALAALGCSRADPTQVRDPGRCIGSVPLSVCPGVPHAGPRWHSVSGAARTAAAGRVLQPSPGFRGAQGREVPGEPRSRLTLPQVHGDPRHALVLDPCSLPRWVHSHPLPLALPRGRRLQPPHCPLSSGAWLLLLLLPRLARAEGAGELEAGGGRRGGQGQSPQAGDLRRDARLQRRRLALIHLQHSPRAYLFFHDRVPGVCLCLLPGRTPPSPGTIRPELLRCFPGWGQLFGPSPQRRAAHILVPPSPITSLCCAFVLVTPLENSVGGSYHSLGASKELVPRVEVRVWFGVFSAM